MPTKRKHEHKAPRQPGYCRHGDRAYTRIQGQWINLGTYGSDESRTLYDRTIAEYLANGRKLPEPEPSAEPEPAPIVMAEIMAGYYEAAESKHSRRRYGAQTLNNVRLALNGVRELFNALPAASFGPKALTQLREWYVAQGLSRKSINDRVRIVKHLVKWATAQEHMPASAWHAVSAVEALRSGESDAREPRKVKPVPDEFIDATAKHVLPEVAAMIKLQRATGMRPGEVVIMRGCDIDMTGPLWLYRPAEHKGQHRELEREVHLGTKAQEITRPYLKADTQAYLFSPKAAVKTWMKDKRTARQSRVQPSQRNRRKASPERKPKARYTVASYRRAITRGCDKAFPVPAEITAKGAAHVEAWAQDHRWHPHQLRHSYATAIRKLYGVEAARIALGHTNIDVTELYAERDREVALRVAREVG